jgi:hypothetical protein
LGISYAYERLLSRLGFDMSKWVTVTKPAAELELDKRGEFTDADGNVITHFKTRFGVRFARLVEPSGFVLWLQEVP